MTNAEARFNNSLRPRKPEGSLGRTAQDGHLDSHTAPELCDLTEPTCLDFIARKKCPHRPTRVSLWSGNPGYVDQKNLNLHWNEPKKITPFLGVGVGVNSVLRYMWLYLLKWVTLTIFVIVRYWYHIKSPKVSLKWCKIIRLVHWSCYYHNLKSQPPQHFIVRIRQTKFSLCSPQQQAGACLFLSVYKVYTFWCKKDWAIWFCWKFKI